MTTMIALVGDQPLPNFLPVKHYQPQNVVLFYSTKTKLKYEYLKATLQKDVHVDGYEVEPYDILAIAQTIDAQILRKSYSQPFLLNLTGGTKPMSLAAYQIAQQSKSPIMYLQSEGKNTYMYHYGWKDQQLHLLEKDILPELVTLKDVFDLHLGPGNWQENGSGRREGSVFEDAIADVLRMNGYEVMVGVNAMNGQMDVDVAVRFGNQYGIIEAKMGKSGVKLDGIKQLSNATRHLGTYSQTLFAITVPPEGAQKMIVEASNVEVISLPTYEQRSNTLPAAEATKLLDKVSKTLKVTL